MSRPTGKRSAAESGKSGAFDGTQRETGKMLGIGQMQPAKYEKGQSAPSLELLRSRGISTANHKAQHVVLDCNYKSSYHVG